MDKYIEGLFFLVDEFNLKYSAQTFENCPFGNYTTKTYSFYNDSGCFTVHVLEQRAELEFYYSNCFSDDLANLHKKSIDVYSTEKKIWNKRGKIFGFIPNLFFWFNNKKILETVAQVIKTQIQNYGEFFGVKV